MGSGNYNGNLTHCKAKNVAAYNTLDNRFMSSVAVGNSGVVEQAKTECVYWWCVGGGNFDYSYVIGRFKYLLSIQPTVYSKNSLVFPYLDISRIS